MDIHVVGRLEEDDGDVLVDEERVLVEDDEVVVESEFERLPQDLSVCYLQLMSESDVRVWVRKEKGSERGDESGSRPREKGCVPVGGEFDG